MQALAVDIGGTFTDFTLSVDSADGLSIDKELTSSENPSEAVLVGAQRILEENGVGFADLDTIIHGTTLVSNTVIEKTGARTGLIATEGARDVLEARRGERYDPYDWQIEYPDPIVPRARRLEVSERVDSSGSVVSELETDELDEVVRELVEDHDVDSIAVSLLHSYAFEDHERQIAERIAEHYPEIPVSISSEVKPVIREYRRTSTTAINAYVRPVIEDHLDHLEGELEAEGFGGELYMMTSNGGIVHSETAKEQPVMLIESGPAGAVLQSKYVGEEYGVDDVFSFDMGGTTAKGSIVEDGDIFTTEETDIARERRFREGSGYPVVTPMVDMTEIGAGGGSIASVSEAGLIEVGPESSGADPGPACYDLGGERPTVTDAALLLGYLDPDNFFGGRMSLSIENAERAVRKEIADPMDLTLTEASWRIFEIVTENMANAFHRHSANRSVDTRNLTMVALGGAGPMTAYRVARKVGIDELICPRGAGVGSSLGITQAPRRYETSQTNRSVLAALDRETVVDQFSTLKREAEEVLLESGVDESSVETQLSLDMRHVNQGREFEVPLPGVDVDEITTDFIAEQFETSYMRKYNRDPLEYPIEVINYRLVLRESDSDSGMGRLEQQSRDAQQTTRSVYFDGDAPADATVYQWGSLDAGARVTGPAVVEADRSTTVVPPDATATLTENRDLTIDLTGGN
jgi:N-methylhydantoinase A/oxoprolinase/acetone carboxylase beta subunit